MRTRKFILKLGAAALTWTTLALVGTPAHAAEYWLRAEATSVNMPDSETVVMWGYASCTDGTFATCDPATVPGPPLVVPPGETTLTVHLMNSLPGGLNAPPTSLVIHGLLKPMTPVWDDNSTGPRGASLTKRVRSFDVEAAPNGTQDYSWSGVGPGTYLYQSGTHPQVQVQMGLYGAATKNVVDAAAATTTTAAIRGQAYGPATMFDNEATLFYSEIDPALHAAVANGDYGPSGTTTSTIDYAPKYFLINGQPYHFGAPAIEPIGSPGVTRLRLLNAGLTTHVPMIKGTFWDVIAEDGKTYPYRRTQYTAMLTAAKTMDVLLTPELGTLYPILDRRLSLSTNGLSDGGMLAFLRISMLGGGQADGTGGNAAPTAVDDSFNAVVGVTLNVAAPGVLANDSDSDSAVVKAVAASGATTGGGTVTLNANGSFTYVPLAGYAGASDTFTYQATDGQALSTAATVTINLSTPAAPALAALDSFNRPDTTTDLGANWAQQTASAPQYADLWIGSNVAYAHSTALGGLAIWNAPAFGAKQGAGFTPGAVGNAYLVLKATGGTTIAPANYVRVGCEAGQIVVATMTGGSNVSAYVRQATLGACGGPMSAVVDDKGLVTVFKGATFVGGVQLPDVSVWKGGGRIGIQLTTAGATAATAATADAFAGGTVP
jgi:FtsP/CotA-like multicopper oxidase with cupredoxin domain